MSQRDRIRVRFNEDFILPRFSVKRGQEWEVRKSKVSAAGFPMGNGFVGVDKYKVLRA